MTKQIPAARLEELGDLSSLIPSFELWLRAANKSPRTIGVYIDSAKQLHVFLRDVGMPTKAPAITREHVGASAAGRARFPGHSAD